METSRRSLTTLRPPVAPVVSPSTSTANAKNAATDVRTSLRGMRRLARQTKALNAGLRRLAAPAAAMMPALRNAGKRLKAGPAATIREAMRERKRRDEARRIAHDKLTGTAMTWAARTWEQLNAETPRERDRSASQANQHRRHLMLTRALLTAAPPTSARRQVREATANLYLRVWPLAATRIPKTDREY
jgi:hypothetical protein